MNHKLLTVHSFEFTRSDIEAWARSRVLQALGPDAARTEPKLVFKWPQVVQDQPMALLVSTTSGDQP